MNVVADVRVAASSRTGRFWPQPTRESDPSPTPSAVAGSRKFHWQARRATPRQTRAGTSHCESTGRHRAQDTRRADSAPSPRRSGHAAPQPHPCDLSAVS